MNYKEIRQQFENLGSAMTALASAFAAMAQEARKAAEDFKTAMDALEKTEKEFDESTAANVETET